MFNMSLVGKNSTRKLEKRVIEFYLTLFLRVHDFVDSCVVDYVEMKRERKILLYERKFVTNEKEILNVIESAMCC